MCPTPLFFIATPKFLAALAETPALLCLRQHFPKLVQCNEESPSHEGLGGPRCRVQRAHAPDPEHSADLSLLPSIPTNCQMASACRRSCAQCRTHNTPEQHRSDLLLSHANRHALSGTGCNNKTTNGRTFAPLTSQGPSVLFLSRAGERDGEHSSGKKIITNFAFDPASSSASSQIPVDKGLLSHLFILLSYVRFSPSTSPT